MPRPARTLSPVVPFSKWQLQVADAHSTDEVPDTLIFIRSPRRSVVTAFAFPVLSNGEETEITVGQWRSPDNHYILTKEAVRAAIASEEALLNPSTPKEPS